MVGGAFLGALLLRYAPDYMSILTTQQRGKRSSQELNGFFEVPLTNNEIKSVPTTLAEVNIN